MAKKKKHSANRTLKKIPYFDYTLLFLVIFIIGFGLVMLYSASAYTATLKTGVSTFYLKKQATAIGVGVVAMIFTINFDYHYYQKYAKQIYYVALALCILVIFAGTNINGQSRWLSIGAFSFQPSELGKIAVIAYLSMIIARAPKAMQSVKKSIIAAAYILPIFAVVAYNNLSTAIIIAGIAFVMIFVANPKVWEFFGLLGLAAGLIIVYIMAGSATYRAGRVQTWLNPETSAETGAYQTLQGLYAIGSGGLFGKGLGESMQKLGFVPEATNDMIFSIICEELGIFGAICIILMYALLIYRIMFIALNAKDLYGTFLCVGIMGHIAIQVVLNIAVVTNTIPNTGVSLPFISYGGTSIMFLMAEMGVVLCVSKTMKVDEGPT